MSDGQDTNPTTQISESSVLNARLDKLAETIDTGFRMTRADISLVANDLTIAKSQIASLASRTEALESAGSRRSDAVKAVDVRTSQQDLEQAAQLAQERDAREELAAKVEDISKVADNLTTVNVRQLAILEGFRDDAKKLLHHPTVRLLIAAVGTFIAGYLGARGIK